MFGRSPKRKITQWRWRTAQESDKSLLSKFYNNMEHQPKIRHGSMLDSKREVKSNDTIKPFKWGRKERPRQLVACQHLSSGQHCGQNQGFFSTHLIHLAPKAKLQGKKSTKSGNLEKQHIFQNKLASKYSLNTIFKK